MICSLDCFVPRNVAKRVRNVIARRNDEAI